MKVKIFDEGHEKDLETAINSFLNELDGEIIDIKYNVRKDKSCVIDAKVTNTGPVDGDEVVQVYLAEASAPHKKDIAGFRRIRVGTGCHTVVKIRVSAEQIAAYKQPVLMVGTSSADIKFTEALTGKM